MATDIDPDVLAQAGRERTGMDYSWLTPITLPYFLAEQWAATQTGKTFPAWMRGKAPKTRESAPAVSVHIYRRTPGKGAFDANKPSYRTRIIVPDSGLVTEVYQKYNTVTYEFKVFHYELFAHADLVQEFEDFMFSIQGVLQMHGCENMLFTEQVAEELLIHTPRADEIYCSVLRYTAHLQQRYLLSYSQLQHARLRFGVVEDRDIRELEVTRNPLSYEDPVDGTRQAEHVTITRVTSIPFEQLQVELVAAQAASGFLGLQIATADRLYVPGVDYTFDNVEYPERGKRLPSIIWLKKEGARQPDPGTTYFVSYSQPLMVRDDSIHLGETNG